MNPGSRDPYLAIINPAAGSGGCGKRAPAVIERLRAAGLEVEMRLTEAPRDATRIGREGYAEGYRNFITGGGDGTDFEVLNGIMPPSLEGGEKVSLGFLPLGTGNAFMRSYAKDYVEYGIESLIAELITGRFEYQDTGLLDATHLRFFTLESLTELLHRHGFHVTNVHRTKRTTEQTSLGTGALRISETLRGIHDLSIRSARRTR